MLLAGRTRLLTSLLVLATLFAVEPLAADGRLRERLEPLLDGTQTPSAGQGLFSGRLLAELYLERNWNDAWDDQRARSMLKLARESRFDGFDPSDFRADEIRALLDAGGLGRLAGAERAKADIDLSDALLRYIHHSRFGKYDPRRINRGQNFTPAVDPDGLKADLAGSLAAPDLAAHVDALVPRPFFYRNLKRGYQRYLAIAERGDWTAIPPGANLHVGLRDSRVPLIRERLALTDGYRADVPASDPLFEPALAESVKGFQRRCGLDSDGVIGPRTLDALNEPVEVRLAKIRANMERMRWLYNSLPDDFVFVDVAAFRLDLIRNGKVDWTTRTIVGTTTDQTPMFRDEMEHIVFNPTWTVPASIQKTMGSVSSRYQVVDRRTGRRVSTSDASDHRRYRIVQPPGSNNALGQVKFMFPNGHAIYLHDTPSRHLFARSERAYSHGCIRVKDPLVFAERLLNKPGWTETEVDRVVERGSTRYVNLDEHLPVLIYYLTAVADEAGRVGFRSDIYQRDDALLAVMGGPAHPPRIAFPAPPPEEHPTTDPEIDPAPAPAALRVASIDGEGIAGDEGAALERASMREAHAAPSSSGSAARAAPPLLPIHQPLRPLFPGSPAPAGQLPPRF